MPACRREPSTIWERRSPWTGFLPIGLMLILLGGCATTSQQTLREHLALDALERHCEPPAGVVSRLALPPVRVRPWADADNLAAFSKPSRDFAGAMGLAPLLADLVEAAKTSGAGAAPHVRFLETRQALSDHLRSRRRAWSRNWIARPRAPDISPTALRRRGKSGFAP